MVSGFGMSPHKNQWPVCGKQFEKLIVALVSVEVSHPKFDPFSVDGLQ